MKECPKCHVRYDDDVVYCTNDGSLLQNVSQDSHSGTEQVSGNSSKKRGVLKTVLIVLAVVLVVLGFLYNKVKNSATYLRTEPSLVTAPKAGGECTIGIDYDGYMWSINHKPEWVRVNEYEKNFSLEVLPNRTGQMREGSITVQSGKCLAQVIIKQKGVATKIEASEKRFHFTKRGGNGSVMIVTDGNDWRAEGPDWLDIRKSGDDRLYIKCPENDDVYRSGSVVVREDNIRYTIDVTQAGMCNGCGGTGECTCPMCNGLGGTIYGAFYTRCIGCGGTGRVRCGYCGGSGERE